MKNIEITILFVLLSVSFLECKKDVSNKEAALPHADSTYEANVPPYTQAENSKIVAGKTPSLYRVVKFDVPFTIYADLKGNGKLSSVTQNDPGSAIKMTPLPRLKKAVDQQIEFVNPESLFLPANESRR